MAEERAQRIGRLREKAQGLAGRLDRGTKFLTQLAAQSGQESAEYAHYFGEWERLLAEENQVLNELEALERGEPIAAGADSHIHSVMPMRLG